MALLFEFDKWIKVKNKDSLKLLLRDVWQQHIFSNTGIEISDVENGTHYQPFLNFDDDLVRANNYVGFISYDDELIEIFPKVFRNCQNPEGFKDLMLQHIFYWFGFCRKWRFPFSHSSIDTRDIKEFPELIINIIANQFLETISRQPLTMYQQVEEALQSPRGSINFSRYVNKSVRYGNYHSVECDSEPFLFDNRVNRIIKYCSRLLLFQTRITDNQRILQEVIFILDEADDLPCTFSDLEGIALNPFFEDYESLMSICSLILRQQLYSNNFYNLSQWCLLFPMEYIFEDFLAGFLQDKFQNKWKVEYQKSEKYLAINEDCINIFNMQHDIFLTSKENRDLKIIVDTKYKLRGINYKEDLKKGVAQTDLYQMVSYAFRRGCSNILLVYPNLTEKLNTPDRFEISSGFAGRDKIYVTAIEIPFWSLSNFNNLTDDLEKVVAENLDAICTCYSHFN